MGHTKAQIRIGDHIRLLKPRYVSRVGYPLCHADVVKELLTERLDDLDKTLELFGLPKIEREFSGPDKGKPKTTRALERIVSGLAYGIVRQRGFGGRERQLFFEPLPEGWSTTEYGRFNVYNVKHVVTGTYYAPCGWQDSWSGEYEYEPGGLENRKQHRLLDVGPLYKLKLDETWILSTDAEKIDDRATT